MALLRTYSSLNAVSIAEDIIRDTVVRPRLAILIDRETFGKITSAAAEKDVTTAEDADSGSLGSAIALNGDRRRAPAFYDFEPVGDIQDGAQAPVARLYNDILAFVSEECGILLDVGERNLAASQPAGPVNGSITMKDEAAVKTVNRTNKQGYHILANVLWHEIASRLMSELGQTIFAAGRTSVFHEVRFERNTCYGWNAHAH